MKQYDAIVIGFGKGGKTLAGKLGASGKTVAMIEKSDRMYGGTCINVGCIPSKSLVRSSGISHGHRNADFEKKQAFYAAAIEEKRRLTAMLRKKNFDKLDGNPNVTVFNGMGSFLSPTQVRVVSDRGETLVLEGKQIFINTGSTPVVPPIEGLRENPFVYLSEGLMDLEKLPRRLAIIGGGYIGLEFASIYAGFGSQVTVFEGAPVFLPREDADIAAEIKKALEAKGVAFQIGAAVKKVADAGDHAEVTFAREGAEETLAADAVLVATGRPPPTPTASTRPRRESS